MHTLIKFSSLKLLQQSEAFCRRLLQEASIGKGEGLSRSLVINFDNIHVIPKASLGHQIGSVSVTRRVEIKRALGYALTGPNSKCSDGGGIQSRSID